MNSDIAIAAEQHSLMVDSIGTITGIAQVSDNVLAGAEQTVTEANKFEQVSKELCSMIVADKQV